MRILITVLSMACMSCLTALPAQAASALTEQQVRNVCGSKLQTGGGNMGCTKACGTGSNLCDYNCKDGKCTGTVFLQVQVETRPTMQMELK